jgi:hypothetical protein
MFEALGAAGLPADSREERTLVSGVLASLI